mmetsp:Transcript_60968/g.54966  ORF Transcript_60968/g.54966 Transcript_60968/m.54966 type:complete len:355 (-) Transcript_60968:161-1225(-)
MMTTSKQQLNKISIELPSKREKSIPLRKLNFARKLESLLDEYDRCLIISITNIGSKQIAELRKEFRNKETRFLFGKNTLIRKVIRDYVKKTKNPLLMNLMELIKGNVGLVFTKNDNLKDIRKQIIEKSRKKSAAKYNSIAPCDVWIPIGPTSMEPTKTQIFQNMDISTRINKGQIDVIAPKKIISIGEKVNASSASLLSQLNIKPFEYSIDVKSIYNKGEIYADCSFMDLDINDIQSTFYQALINIASLCAELNYPTIINVPHNVINAYKQVIALSMNLQNYSWNGLRDIEYALQEATKKKKREDENDNNDMNQNNNDNNDDDDNNSSSPAPGLNPFDSGSDTDSSEESSSDEE